MLVLKATVQTRLTFTETKVNKDSLLVQTSLLTRGTYKSRIVVNHNVHDLFILLEEKHKG